ncbi:MAG: A/G-specific adenine glycosylase [Proteobacteria bacterium]|nr:A/G-specific adenine glycosylase [Pseudomonadota bacterium]
MNEKDFARRILRWFDSNGRHDLPWQQNPHPYRVWISEIMLQQTQVAAVIPYYQRFTERFPTVQALAEADIDQVLHLWTGLGYYARARNLHKTAQIVVEEHGGAFPHSLDKLEALPGIGKSTAGAIAALSMNIRAPILDGNVKRVLTRAFAIEGWPEQTRIKHRLWEIAASLTPNARVPDYTQAMMDLGATVCTRSRPACNQCPLSADCEAFNQVRIASYPGRKPSKTLPVKSVAMFILQNESGEVLLEKRPPQGIWGSLYSLPESPSVATPPTINKLEVSIEGSLELESIRHTFSHYHLDIKPIKLRRQCLIAGVAEKDRWLWYPLDHSMEVGLAAPVKKLLSRLATCQ